MTNWQDHWDVTPPTDAPDKPQKERYQLWPERMVRGIVDSFISGAKMPHDVAYGEDSPENVGRVLDLAGIAMGGMKPRTPGLMEKPGPGLRPTMPEGGLKPTGAIPAEQSAAGAAHVQQFEQQTMRAGQEAGESIARGFDPKRGQMIAPDVATASEFMRSGMARAAQYERQQARGQFDVATATRDPTTKQFIKPASLAPTGFMTLPQSISQDLAAEQIMVDQSTKYAQQAIKDLTGHANALAEKSRGVPGGGKISGVNLADVDRTKQRLLTYRKAAFESGNQKDMQATHAILQSFDKQVDAMVNSKAFSGGEAQVKAWNVAREREDLYRTTFESSGKKSPSEAVQRIIGENPYGPGATQSMREYLYGAAGINAPQFNAAVASHMKGIVGADSAEWIGAKQGVWQDLLQPKPGEWKPAEISKRIIDYVDGSGKSMAAVLYSPAERNVMRKFAYMQRDLEIKRLPPNAGGQTVQRITQGIGAAIGGVLGTKIGGPIGTALGTLAGERMGARVGGGFKSQSRELSDLEKKLPLLRQKVNRWSAAMQKHQTNSLADRQGRYIPTVALVREFNKAGIPMEMPPPSAVGMAEQGGKRDKLSFGGPAM